jgi:RNA-binding protein YhbY
MRSRDLNDLKPTVWIGKSGIDDMLFKEINKQLRLRRFIKAKVNKNIKHDFDNILAQILNNTNSELIERKGLTFVLVKK